LRTTTAETKFLTIDEKVHVSRIDINRKDSKISMAIIECDSCNSVQDASQRKAQVVFPKDYLAGADGGQISDVIRERRMSNLQGMKVVFLRGKVADVQ
jgi:hypothetical protein